MTLINLGINNLTKNSPKLAVCAHVFVLHDFSSTQGHQKTWVASNNNHLPVISVNNLTEMRK